MRSDKHSPALTRTQRARRDDIVAAAVEVINRDGYEGASIGRIAAQAGTSKSTVLYHFKTKHAVDEAVVGSLFEDGAAYMAPGILAARSYPEKLEAYLASNLRYIGEHTEHVRAVHRITQSSAAVGEDGDDPVVWLEHFLSDGQAAGDFGAFDAHVLALTIRSVIDLASVQLTTRPDLGTERYVREVVRLFDRATRPPSTGDR